MDENNKLEEGEPVSSTLKLLEQYENHTQQKDKNLDYIEKGDSRFDSNAPSGPSYDELFKENVKLRLKIEEYEAEIKALNEVISGLREGHNTTHVPAQEYVPQKIIVDSTTDSSPREPSLLLPPRSADRVRHNQNTIVSRIEQESHELVLPRSPATFQLNSRGFRDELKGISEMNESRKEGERGSKLSPTENDTTYNEVKDSAISSNSGTFNNNNNILGSPATSVTYTTSRISINSSSPKVSTKSNIKGPNSPALLQAGSHQQGGPVSPHRANRVTHLINNEIRSPLKEQFSDTDVSFATDDVSSHHESQQEREFVDDLLHKSPIIQRLSKDDEHIVEFSPSSKQNLNKFTEMINKTFGEDDKITNDRSTANTAGPFKSPPKFDPPLPSANHNTLASPVIIQNSSGSQTPSSATNIQRAGISSLDLLKNASQDNISSISSATTSNHQSFSPRSVSSISRIQPPTFPTSTTDTGSPTSVTGARAGVSAQSPMVSEIPLFVQPEDFSTIRVEIRSTLYHNPEDSAKSVLFSVVDKKSSKEMFKFAKSPDQILQLDHLLKVRLIEQYHLPLLPRKQLFQSSVPVKVDARRELLEEYFTSLFEVDTLPPLLSLKLAQFISTDTAITMPMGMSENIKEGVLLVRKNKTLGTGNSWKVRQAIVDEQTLLLLDQGNLVENVRLANSTIELQANLPDDKYGTKNGFIVNEHRKTGLSNTSKHYFAAETAKQREEWISALISVCGSAPPNVRADNFSSTAMDQNSISDASVDTSYSAKIGPMVNLEALNKPQQSQQQQSESNSSEIDRETKRNRMRSFFPFKKNQGQLSTSSFDISKESDESTDRIFSNALRNMNLQEECVSNVVFGSDVKHCLSLSSKIYQSSYEVPSVVYRCLEYLYKNRAIEEEGIFRLSGSSALIKMLQEQFDREYDINLSEYNDLHEDGSSNGSYLDVNTVTGLLKLYFRRLPHLIFGDEMYDEFRSIAETNSNDSKEIAVRFRDIVCSGKIEKENYALMYVLFELLMKINENNKVNKMNLRNLCIVFSPTLNIPVNILQPFIEDFHCIFNGKEPVNNEDRQNLNLRVPQM